jgi:phosphomannomutase
VKPQLRDAAFRWIADDPDAGDRAELQRVLAAALAGSPAQAAELAERMAGPLTFGTAGLRGPLRAGPNGMNHAVVARSTAGLGDWLLAHGRAGGTVVVGRDARRRSEQFCTTAAGVLAGAGFDVRVLPRPLPTPVLAFAVRHLDAVAGVQITASHNPPDDNGYKVYLDAGAQIISPVDAEIEAAIAAVPAAVSVPVGSVWVTLGEDVVESYLDRVATLPRGTERSLRIALTPLHGVGGASAVSALNRAGFTDVHVVTEQFDPDAAFPTVGFPNPEEPGATDLLLALAASVGADVAIALDPDADRCALGVRDHRDHRDFAGPWRMLRGDETGALLGQHILATLDRAAHPDPLVATTIVSSSLLGSIAGFHGVRYDETLTGFKWIVRAGDGLGTGLVYGYEEALGLCADPDHVRDKDGISAAVLACDLAATAKAAGRSLPDLLDALAVRHGLHLTDQLTVPLSTTPPDVLNAPPSTPPGVPSAPPGAPGADAMVRIRANLPSTLAGQPVTVEDLLPRTDAVRLTGDGLRVVVRPSGTEPKLKAYLQVVEPVPSEATLPAARDRATDRLNALRSAVAGVLGPR